MDWEYDMKRPYRFSKYHGLGNDFVILDGIHQRLPEHMATLSMAICDRHMGIGADGVLLLLPSDHSDFRMQIFNADGSEAQMCGNGIRCFATYIFETGLSSKEVLSIETMAGVMVPAINHVNGKVTAIEVDMGTPRLTKGMIPMQGNPQDAATSVTIDLGDSQWEGTGVSMGNPHVVIFGDDWSQLDIETIGPAIEQHPLFPDRTNVEFVTVHTPETATMRVWERGSGETMACGTGACATLVAGVLTHRLARRATIHLPGGDLLIEWLESNDHVMMTGPAVHVYDGVVNL